MRQTLSFLLTLTLMVALALSIRAWVASLCVVRTAHPRQEMLRGDRVLVWKLAREFRQGDLVVFGNPSKSIGRIEAVPGDTITVDATQYLIPRPCLGSCTCHGCSIYLVVAADSLRHVLRGSDIIGRAYRIFPLRR
ncbi:MAG: signal peptidase [Prevotella sp.]|nr:signal peptidase [Prevotella sp.]